MANYLCLPTRRMLTSEPFPDMYTGDQAPAAFGVRDSDTEPCTPCYSYGWVVPRDELYKAINGKLPYFRNFLLQVHIAAEKLLYVRWTEKGYDDNEYNPNIPRVAELGPKYVVVYLACNDTDAIIRSVMENEKLHEECRSCLRNPKSMESRPAWIIVGTAHLPKGVAVTINE